MFQSISWKDFFYDVAVLGGLYYTGIGLLLYREELKSLFTDGPFNRKEKLASEISQGAEGSFIGKTANPVKKEEAGEDELRFAPFENSRDEDHEAFTASLDTTLVGTVADLGEDIKKLSEGIVQATRGQVGDRFRALLKKYAKLDSTSYRPTINLLISETIREKSSHMIDPREVDTWWPMQEINLHKNI